MSKHLTLSDRAIIEKYLALDVSFAYIARHLNRSATTISREVKNHRCFVNGNVYTNNDCAYYRTCLRRNFCDTERDRNIKMVFISSKPLSSPLHTC